MRDTLPIAEKQSVAPFLVNGLFRIRLLNEAHLVAKFLADLCPNPRLAVVGISEILVNAIEHGNLGISYEEKSALQQQDNWLEEIDRRLSLPQHQQQYVEILFNKSEVEIQIKVTDQGKGFNAKKFEQGEADASTLTHGRGILLAKQLSFKTLTYSKKGNEVTCIIAL